MTINLPPDPPYLADAESTPLRRVGRFIRIIDRSLRWFDFHVNLTYGGALARFAISRHMLAAVCLPAAIVFFFVNGPSLRVSPRLGIAAIAMLMSLGLFIAVLRYGERRGRTLFADLLWQCGLLACIGAAVWFLAPAASVERSPYLYRHVILPAVAVVAAATLIAALRSRQLFGARAWAKSRPGIAARLAHVELFAPRLKQPVVTLPVLLLGMLNAVISQPARVLFFPCLFTLLVERDWVSVTFIGTLAASLVVMAFANIDARFKASGDLFGRPLFSGWPAVVSLLIIVLGIARAMDFHYVSTIFDGARNYTIGGYLIALYVVLWWHHYWVENLMTVRLLGLLEGSPDDRSRIPYPIAPTTARRNVPADARVIQAHGAGRLLVLHSQEDAGRGPLFHNYTLVEMADALADDLSLNDTTRLDLDWARWRIQGDRLLATVVLAAMACLGGWLLMNNPQVPHIAPPGPSDRQEPPIPVANMLFGGDACTSGRPILAVAASGGGTRAALYTASALERLHLAGYLADVRLLSGVSGGGAALTYFAAHRADLIAPDSVKAWEDYFTAMRQPYIEDVLDGSGEWRLAAGVRLGRLLAESFERHWRAPDRRFGAVTDVGLMLNSSIAGRFVREKTASPPALSLAEDEVLRPNDGLSDVAGGRVVFTNLDLPDHLDNPAMFADHGTPRETRDARLPIFVVNGAHVRLTDAAAANANFPPVFSNVPIDRDHATRIWVTDGGAVDNRGTETLLMAIRYGLRQPQGLCATPPPLHVLQIDASAFSDGYQQDRGIGSLMAAGTAFASQLDAELLAELGAEYGGMVRFHHLPMPALLRRSGSFGTHWMMQERVRVCEDARCDGRDYTLTGDDVVTILRALQHEALPADATAEARDAHRFILSEGNSSDVGDLKRWTLLTECLRGASCQ